MDAVVSGDAKRLKLESNGLSIDKFHELSDILSHLHSLVTSAGEDGHETGVEQVLQDVLRLQDALHGCMTSVTAFKAVGDAQDKLQAAILALQAAVDRYQPPPGYQPPQAGDADFVRGLLSYAHRLSYSSSAPLGYQPGQPLYFFKPPAPQEAEMRVSQLHAFNREWEARKQAAVAQRQASAAAQGAVAAAAAVAVHPPQPGAEAQALPPSDTDLAALAAGHGLDVQQLLASMPAGWKPGDPIPLAPPAAAATGGAQPAAPAARQPPEREERPAEEERSPRRAAPLLTGIFLDDFAQYDYVSGEEGSEEDSDDADSD